MSLTFQGLGWEVKLRQRRYSYFLTLPKELILGNGLRRGESLYFYLTRYEGRNTLLIYLDGKNNEHLTLNTAANLNKSIPLKEF